MLEDQNGKRKESHEFDVDLKDQNLELIVDGGSENNNKTIAEFIKNCHVNISKKIALKDVTFSNSIVEEPYKIMKSYYFRSKEILSTTIYQELKFLLKIITIIDLVTNTRFTLQTKFIIIPNWRISNWFYKIPTNRGWKKTVISAVRFLPKK